MYIKKETGKLGEDIAGHYLKQNGYVILDRNFECRQGEIDIIALDKKEIVFIEVKTRTSNKYGAPSEAVNKIKQKHMLQTIKYYLYIRNLSDEFIRIDVIEVYINNNVYKVNHIKQAFEGWRGKRVPKGAKGDGEFWQKIMQKLKGHLIQDVLLVGD